MYKDLLMLFGVTQCVLSVVKAFVCACGFSVKTSDQHAPRGKKEKKETKVTQ